MKKLLALLITASALTFAAPALAQTPAFVPINQRQAQLDQRIDAGVRLGQLNQAEARQLRADFRAIANLETQYRRNGLSVSERNDLEARINALSARIGAERHDTDRGANWQPINQRQAALDARIDAGVNSGQLSRTEAASLRTEFRNIAALEARYRQSGGLSQTEIGDLERRFDLLSNRIRDNRNDDEYRAINDRQQRLAVRIDAGVRDGTLTSSEARIVRNDFRQIEQLEASYRPGGLTNAERTELTRRLDALTTRLDMFISGRY